MKTDAFEELQRLFDHFELDWFPISFATDPKVLVSRFDEFANIYGQRVASLTKRGELPRTVDVESIYETAKEDPDRVAAFLQLFASSCGTEILAMSWALLHDATVSHIELQFRQQEDFALSVVLDIGCEGEKLAFESDYIFDLTVLRHLGLMKVDGRPVVSGLYPLNMKWR